MIAGVPGPFEIAALRIGKWLASKCHRPKFSQTASEPLVSPRVALISPREHMSAFLRETIEPSAAGSAVSLRSVNQLYLGWCSAGGHIPLSLKQLGLELRTITTALGLSHELTRGDVLIGGIRLRRAHSCMHGRQEA